MSGAPVPDSSKRRELKFTLLNAAAGTVSSWLDGRCMPDPDFAAGTVHSIYFDTPDMYFLRQKINSEHTKTKIRLRWYSGLAEPGRGSGSYFEIKSKEGLLCRKFRMKTEWTGADLAGMDLASNEFNRLNRLLGEQGFNSRGGVFPVLEITYRRRRYLEPATKSRICLDSDISVPRVNFPMVPCGRPAMLETAVFEYKGPAEDLPPAISGLVNFGCRKSSFSKYLACYQKAGGSVR